MELLVEVGDRAIWVCFFINTKHCNKRCLWFCNEPFILDPIANKAYLFNMPFMSKIVGREVKWINSTCTLCSLLCHIYTCTVWLYMAYSANIAFYTCSYVNGCHAWLLFLDGAGCLYCIYMVCTGAIFGCSVGIIKEFRSHAVWYNMFIWGFNSISVVTNESVCVPGDYR